MKTVQNANLKKQVFFNIRFTNNYYGKFDFINELKRNNIISDVGDNDGFTTCDVDIKDAQAVKDILDNKLGRKNETVVWNYEEDMADHFKFVRDFWN